MEMYLRMRWIESWVKLIDRYIEDMCCFRQRVLSQMMPGLRADVEYSIILLLIIIDARLFVVADQ